MPNPTDARDPIRRAAEALYDGFKEAPLPAIELIGQLGDVREAWVQQAESILRRELGDGPGKWIVSDGDSCPLPHPPEAKGDADAS